MPRLLLISTLSIAAAVSLSACGSSSSTATTATTAAPAASTPVSIYIDETPGRSNGQDAPLLDKFWFGDSADATYAASYSVNLSKGGSIKFINQGDDPQKVTITGPDGYSATPEIAEGPNSSTTVTLPSVAGAYQFTSMPEGDPARPGGQGGVANVS